MNKCSYGNCISKRMPGKGISFHRIPKDDELKQQWIKNIKSFDENIHEDYILCSNHFEPKCFYSSLKYKRLKRSSVPTKFQEYINADASASFLDHNYAFQDFSKFKKGFDDLNENYSDLKSKYEKLLTKSHAQEKELRRLSNSRRKSISKENVIEFLESRLSKEVLFIIKRAVEPKSEKESYPPEMRKFIMTLNFYSPRAYLYLRDKLNKGLPHPKTIQHWMSELKKQPGFSYDVFDLLELKGAKSSQDHQL